MKAFKNNLREVLGYDERTHGEKLLNIIRSNRPENENYEKIEKVISEYIENLSIGISNLVNVFEPEAIGIGGSFVYFEDVLLNRLKQEILKPNLLFNERKDIIIETAILGNDAGMIGAVWMIGTIKDKAPQTEGKWSVIDLPKIEGGEFSSNNGGSDLTINAKTEFPEEAKDFCEYAMTDSTLQASGFEKYGLYPSYIPSYEEEIFSTGDRFFGESNIYEVFITNGQKVANTPISPNIQEATDSIAATVSDIFLNGADITKAMQDLQSELETKFQ